jgi:hypothetical protein
MALHNHFILTQQHGPSLQEGEHVSGILDLFARDLVLGFQGTQQDTLQVVFDAGAQNIIHVQHQQTFASTGMVRTLQTQAPPSAKCLGPKDSCHI